MTVQPAGPDKPQVPAPEADKTAAIKRAATRIRKSWKRQSGERKATIIILTLLIGGALYVWVSSPTLAVMTSGNPALAIPESACAVHPVSPHPVKVSDASGAVAALNIFVGRGGTGVKRQSTPLAIQGSLPPGTALCMASSDLVRSDGQTMPGSQVASWAIVTNDGGHVTVSVEVAPRYEFVSGFGEFSGTVSLDDPRALGANIPVNINVEYYDIAHPVAWGFLAAFGGFVWAWFLHKHVANPREPQLFLASLTLRVAVLLVAAVPVINAQVLANPDWEGSLTQYITLASLAGAAAIAVTPTLHVITSSPGGQTQGNGKGATGGAGQSGLTQQGAEGHD